MTITDDYGRYYDINVKNITYIERKTYHGSMATYFNIIINFTRNQQITVSYDDLETRDSIYEMLKEATK